MLDGIVQLIQGFSQFLTQFIDAIFGGLGAGVKALFLDETSPSAFAYIAFAMIALSLAIGLTRWITSWLRGRLG